MLVKILGQHGLALNLWACEVLLVLLLDHAEHAFFSALVKKWQKYCILHYLNDNDMFRSYCFKFGTLLHFYFVYVCFPLVVCGGTLNATTNIQTLTSPFFPNAYPSFTSCRWILDAPAQETIQLSVKTFILHSSQSCSANYLEIKDWPVVSSETDKLISSLAPAYSAV